MGKPDQFLPTRDTLLVRLRQWQDQDSWREFFELYWKLIYTTACRAGLSDAEAQDVVQETIISVSKHLPTFRYNPSIGSFKAWLLRITRCRITDQLRKRMPRNDCRQVPAADDTKRTDAIERLPDPNSVAPGDIWDAEWEKNLMDVAIARVKNKVKPKQFQIFDLYVFKQWPVKVITTRFKIGSAQVYLAKHRVARLIRDEIKQLQRYEASLAHQTAKDQPSIG